MKFNPDVHHRHSIRLNGFDYSSNGLYFITICTQDRAMLFGEVVGADLVSAQMKQNDAGRMIAKIYTETIVSIPNIDSDIFIVMPNHFHCILRIEMAEINRADTRSAPTIPMVIQTFKSKTTVEYINGVKTNIYTPFNKRVWQRNYYEHIIRDEADYQKIWQYIDENPAKWQDDCYYK